MKQSDQKGPGCSTLIGEVASSFGVSTRTLRFYESQGLIVASRKSRSRVYSATEVDRIRLVLKLKSFGLSVLEIRAALDRPADGPFGLTGEQYAKQLASLRKK